MDEEFHSIDVGENGGRSNFSLLGQADARKIATRSACFGELLGKCLIVTASLVAQCSKHGLSQKLNIPVFAEDHGDDQPVVGGADGAIAAVESIKGYVLPARDVGGVPRYFLSLFAIFRRAMGEVLGGEGATAWNGLGGLPNNHPVHGGEVTLFKILVGKLMLGGNIVGQLVGFPFHLDDLARMQVSQRHHEIVLAGDLHCCFGARMHSRVLCLESLDKTTLKALRKL